MISARKAVALALTLFALESVYADAIWTATSGTGQMSDTANWQNAARPVNGANLVFNPSSLTKVVNDFSSLSVTNITFAPGIEGSGGFKISGNALSVTGTISQQDEFNTHVIKTDLILANDVSFNTLSSTALTMQGAISGDFQLIKTGSGALTLSTANTYSGGTRILEGTLKLSGAGTPGSTSGALSFGTGGSLSLNGTSPTVGSLSSIDALTEGAPAQGSIFNNTNGTQATLTIGHGGTAATATTFTGAIVDHTSDSGTGTVALVKTSDGDITLTGANTFSGGTTVSAGTLTLGALTTFNQVRGMFTIDGGALHTSVERATLGGNLSLLDGTIALDATAAGQLFLYSSKSFTMSGGTIEFTLGTESDRIDCGGDGTLTLTGGTFAFDTGASGFDYANSYDLFLGFNPTSFAAVTLTGYDTDNYLATISDLGVLSFTPLSAIPEPSTYAALAGLAALALAAVHRRQKIRPNPLSQS